MANRKRLCKILIYLLVLTVSVGSLYWFGNGESFSAEMAFRRQEKQHMIGPSEIFAKINFYYGAYDCVMIGRSEHGYTFYELNLGSQLDNGKMTYIPKQEGATLYCTYYRYGSERYSQDWLPIFAFTDQNKAVRAKLTLVTNQNDDAVAYHLEAEKHQDGYFLFSWNTLNLRSADYWLVQQLIAAQHREYILKGTATATLELFDAKGNLLETYHFTK